MSSGETAKSTASEELPDATRDDANATRTDTTSDVSEVAKRVADPQHAESAPASFEDSASAADARNEGTSHDAADALDAYARISMPGASVASASDAASSESFLAWLKSDNGGSKRGRVEESAEQPSAKPAPAGESLAIVSSEESNTAAALPEAKAKDSGNSLMTQVPSAAEIAAVEASLDVLGLSNPPPPPTRERVAKPADVAKADADADAEPARDAGKRTSVEELTDDEVIERVSIEPDAPVPLTRPASVAPPIPLTRPASAAPPPLPAAALDKPPTIPLPKSVAPPARAEEADGFTEGPTWLTSERPKVRPQRVSAPSLEALAGPVARSTARPPPDPEDPLAMPSLASTAATALSLVPPSLPLTERTTEPPPTPKSGDKKSGGLKPPPSPKVSSAPAHEDPRSNGNSLFGGMVGFVLGCVATAVAMKAVSPPPSANASPAQAAVCAEPAGAPNTTAASVATPSAVIPTVSSTTTTSVSNAEAESNASNVAASADPATTTSASTLPSTSTSSASSVPAAAILPPPSVAPAAHVNPSVPVSNTASPPTTVATATDADHHRHHATTDVNAATGATTGASSAHSTPTATAGTSGTTTATPSSTASTTTAAATPHDAEEPSTVSCARRCGGNADCLIACHRGGTAASTTSSTSSTSTTSTTATHDTPPAVNDPPPVAEPDHDSPPRDEVVDAMGRIREAIVHCATGDENNPTHANQISVTFTFASSGRVTIALVGAPFAGTPAGSCIARAARSALVTPFAQNSFRVVYPFTM